MIVEGKESVPRLFDGAVFHWDLDQFKSSLLDFEGELSQTETTFRIAPLTRKKMRTIREHECASLKASLRDFLPWASGGESAKLPDSNPFSRIPPVGSVSAYADYKHFSELFPSPELPTFGHWGDIFERLSLPLPPSSLNFDASNMENVTLWIGSHGSHTPLHYDSNGYNIVVQIAGTKKWQLWRPENEKWGCDKTRGNESTIHPLRVPYEESSIYSSFDPMSGDGPAPDFEFDLKKGDVLVIPKHFWHFVRTPEDDMNHDSVSISANMWVPLASDAWDKVTEATTRFIYASMHSSLREAGFDPDNPRRGWLGPSEDPDETCDHGTNVLYVAKALDEWYRLCASESGEGTGGGEGGGGRGGRGGSGEGGMNEGVTSHSDIVATTRQTSTSTATRPNVEKYLKSVIGQLLRPESLDACIRGTRNV